MEGKKIEGTIERIGYEDGANRIYDGVIYLILVDDHNVYCSYEANSLYADVTFDEQERALLLLTQKGDHITFQLDQTPYEYGDPLLKIETYSLRNRTLEKRLTHSLKDIASKDKSLPSSRPKLSNEGS